MGNKKGTFDYSQSTKQNKKRYKSDKSTKQDVQNSNVKHSFVNALKSGTIVQAFKNAAIQVVRNNNNPAHQQSARKIKPSPPQKSGNPLYKYGCVKGKK